MSQVLNVVTVRLVGESAHTMTALEHSLRSRKLPFPIRLVNFREENLRLGLSEEILLPPGVLLLGVGSEVHSRQNSLACLPLCVLLCPTLCDFTDVACQAPLSMGFFPAGILEWVAISYTPGDLPDPGIVPGSLVSLALAGIFFTTEPPRKPHRTVSV